MERSTRSLSLRLHTRLLPLLTVGYGLLCADRTNLSFAKLAMNNELALSDESFGLASGMLFLTYALMQLPATQLSASALGPRRLLGGVLILSGASSFATAFVSSADALVALRALLGVAEAGYFPSTILFLSTWYPDAAAGEAVGIFMSVAWTLATFLGSGSACAMPLMDGALGLSQWRWLFLVQGGGTILCGGVLLGALPAAPERVPWLSEAERRCLLARHAAAAGSAPRLLGGALRDVLRHRALWPLGLLWFTASIMQFASVFFLPLLLSELLPTLPLCSVMLILGANGLAAVGVNYRVSAWADRGGAARRFALAFGVVLFCGSMLTLIGLALHATAQEPRDAPARAVVAQLAVGGFAVQSLAATSMSGAFFALHHTAMPPTMHALSIPTINSMGLLGGFVGPYALGAMHDRLGPRCPPGAPPPPPPPPLLHHNASDAPPQSRPEEEMETAAAAAAACLTEWAWALALTGLGALAMTAVAWSLARAGGLARSAPHEAQEAPFHRTSTSMTSGGGDDADRGGTSAMKPDAGGGSWQLDCAEPRPVPGAGGRATARGEVRVVENAL